MCLNLTTHTTPNAIKVLWNGVHLGYIPKSETETVRTFKLTEMRVVEVEPSRKWDEVYIENIEILS